MPRDGQAKQVAGKVSNAGGTTEEEETEMPITRRLLLVLTVALAVVIPPRASTHAFDVVLNAQGEFMDAYLVNGTALPPKVVFIDPDPPNPDILGTPPRVGRHVNGKLCFFPRGGGLTRKFVIADDTYRESCLDRNPPQARCGVTRRGSRFFIGKTLWQAGLPAMDEAGNIYVAETGAGMMWKYSPPFPSSAADCNNADHLVTTPPTKTMFPTPGEPTPAAIVRVPGTDHWYIDSVLLPGVPGQGGGLINEYDANGVLVRNIVPSNMLQNPLGMDVGSDGTLYYAELNLNADTSTGCGRVSMVRFVGGTPQAPQVLGRNLSFPDGVTVMDSSRFRVNFLKLPPAPEPDPRTCNGGGGSPSGAFVDG